MALEQTLRLQPQTSLVMTPQLQQAIKLLQLSHQELESFISEQVAENPFLTLSGEASTEFSKTDPVEEPKSSFEDCYGKSSASMSTLTAEQEDWLENTVASCAVTLQDHLLNQINSELTEPVERSIATYLIGYVQPTGYFEGDLEEIALQLGTSLPLVENVLKKLKTFEPSGICSQNLRECLAIQLDDQGLLSKKMIVLLENLDLLAKGNLAVLGRRCHLSSDELTQAIQQIRSLNPKPGVCFESSLPATVVPEVLMFQDPETGGWAVDLNYQTMPKVLLNTSYYTRIKETLKEREEKKYLNDRFAHANWLIKALHQRATTLIRVSQEIIRQQEDFFTYGIGYLKPMVLKDVAQSVDLHESTVSRVTNNKYMATPRGVFELKYFFTSSLQGASGIQYASTTIRHRIQKLISQENPTKPVSDDAIVKRLEEEGIHVARRTVAKYRDMLKIPPAFQRKRWQNLS